MKFWKLKHWKITRIGRRRIELMMLADSHDDTWIWNDGRVETSEDTMGSGEFEELVAIRTFYMAGAWEGERDGDSDDTAQDAGADI